MELNKIVEKYEIGNSIGGMVDDMDIEFNLIDKTVSIRTDSYSDNLTFDKKDFEIFVQTMSLALDKMKELFPDETNKEVEE